MRTVKIAAGHTEHQGIAFSFGRRAHDDRSNFVSRDDARQRELPELESNRVAGQQSVKKCLALLLCGTTVVF